MKILLHGSSGFVASYLLPRLQFGGACDVLCFDIKPPSPPTIAAMAAMDTRCRMVVGDSLSSISDADIDLVVSLAGVTDVDYALSNPAVAFTGNIRIAIELAEWLRNRASRARAIYISTDEVLGESREPLAEHAPIGATQPYAVSKAAAELILHNYRDVYDLDIVTLRSCNLVGGNQRAHKIIPVAVKALCNGDAVPIYGSGDHSREWMSVEDLCSAILLLSDRRNPRGVYQAGTGVHLTVKEVVQIVADALGTHLRTKRAPDRLVHDACYAMNPQRLSALGWRPTHNPREAIADAAREMALAFSRGELQLSR